jgi:type IV pilus assembly protein PilV
MNPKGFTLLEILIALAILAMGILAIAGMQMTAVRGNFFSDNIMQASVLGQDRLEELKAIPLNQGTGTFSLGIHNDGVIPVRGTNFTRNYAVEPHPVLTESRVLRVTISWRDTTDHNLSFSTVKSP